MDEIQITQVVDDILERAMQIAQHKKAKVMDVQSLSLALLQTASCVATEILHRYDIDENVLLMQMEHGGRNELDKVNELRNLNTCGLNQDIIGRDKELSFMISVLSRKDKANPLSVSYTHLCKFPGTADRPCACTRRCHVRCVDLVLHSDYGKQGNVR